MGVHVLSVTIEQGVPVSATFLCHAPKNADSPCHIACTRPDCEEGCVCRSFDLEPLLVDQGECMKVLWLNEMEEWVECYEGPLVGVRTAPVDITWDGDTYVWSYTAGA